NPQHCLLFDYFGGRSRIEDLLSLYGIYQDSRSDLLEEPPLHEFYRRSGACQTLFSKLRSATLSDIEEEDVLGETLIFKALKSDDEGLGKPIFETLWSFVISSYRVLHYIAESADSKTIGILKAVRWNTANIDTCVNGMDEQRWTPYRIMNWRRYNNAAWAQATDNQPNDDPEEIFQSFMELVQKIVDDYYGLKTQQTNKYRVLVPLPGSRTLDIVRDSLLTVDTESPSHEEFRWDDEDSEGEEEQWEDEDSEGEEQWEDAVQAL
ncbi:MAG: hypothetical protein Q9169_008525, partial [Polycauliona sp. 2 TL-2023]